jgi:hypothetical protein
MMTFSGLPGFKFILACLMASFGLSAFGQNGWVGMAVGLAFGRMIADLVFRR